MADEEHEPTCCERFSAGLSNFFKFLYNNETGQVMGRSGTSWAKIGFFYLIFYGFLAGFFSGMLAVFLSTLNDPATGPPKLTQYVANQPGLTRLDEYLPGATKLTLKYDKVKTKYDSKVKEDYKKTIDNFLQKYTKGVFTGKPACNAKPLLGKTKDAECQYNTTELLGACMATNTSFGLENEAPCIFIRINKVYGWIPKDTASNGYLELRCIGKGLVAVYPPGGFLINAFPFKGQNRNDFELPVVAVQVNRTTLEQVDCKLVGDDIETSTSYVPSRAFGNIRIK